MRSYGEFLQRSIRNGWGVLDGVNAAQLFDEKLGRSWIKSSGRKRGQRILYFTVGSKACDTPPHIGKGGYEHANQHDWSIVGKLSELGAFQRRDSVQIVSPLFFSLCFLRS